MTRVSPSSHGYEQVAEVLEAGGVALVPTDTVYGLAALPAQASAGARIFDLKGRPYDKNLPFLVDSISDIRGLGAALSPAAVRLIDSDYMPGPLTLALGFDDSRARPTWLQGRIEVAVRIPADRELRGLIRRVGPLLCTSANASGSAVLQSVDEILPTLSGVPDIVVDGGSRSSVASTLVNCRPDPPVVEREGAIPAETILEVLRGE